MLAVFSKYVLTCAQRLLNPLVGTVFAQILRDWHPLILGSIHFLRLGKNLPHGRFPLLPPPAIPSPSILSLLICFLISCLPLSTKVQAYEGRGLVYLIHLLIS